MSYQQLEAARDVAREAAKHARQVHEALSSRKGFIGVGNHTTLLVSDLTREETVALADLVAGALARLKSSEEDLTKSLRDIDQLRDELAAQKLEEAGL